MEPQHQPNSDAEKAWAEKDGQAILTEVIWRALATTYRRAGEDGGMQSGRSQAWANKMSGHWIHSLRDAFQRQYGADHEESPVVVFGGKMDGGSPEPGMAEFGIKGWNRREFMYDISVVRKSYVDAAFRTEPGEPNQPKQVAVIKQAIWLVESEMAKNGTAVAEDVSKLHIGRSINSLLIAAKVGGNEKERWLSFIGRAMAGIEGNAFIALIPTYASGDKASADWSERTVEIDLYRCQGVQLPSHFAAVTAVGLVGSIAASPTDA